MSQMTTFEDLQALRNAAVTRAQESCAAAVAKLRAQQALAEAERDKIITKTHADFEDELESRRAVFAVRVHEALKPLAAAFRSDDSKLVSAAIVDKFKELDAQSRALLGVALDTRAIAVAFAAAIVDEFADRKESEFVGAHPEEFFGRQGTFEYAAGPIGNALNKLPSAVAIGDAGTAKAVFSVLEAALAQSRASAARYPVTTLAKDRWGLVCTGSQKQLSAFDSDVERARNEAASQVNREIQERTKWAKLSG